MSVNHEITTWAAGLERQIYRKEFPPSLDPIAAEIVGARLMRVLGIGAPAEFRVTESLDGIDTTRWVVKSANAEGRLKLGAAAGARRFVLIERIPNAISLTALRNRFGITAPLPGNGLTASLTEEFAIEANRAGLISTDALVADERLYSDRSLVQDVMMLVRIGKDDGGRFDFRPPADWAPVQTAIAWGSEPMLLIHAARAFLACSTAHAGNILVDANGKLYSVDHECCSVTDGMELELLARHVKPGTRAAKALKRIAEIQEREIRELFDDLPTEVSWPMGSREITIEHYLRRRCN